MSCNNSLVIRNAGKAYKKYPSHFARLIGLLNPSPISKNKLHWVLRGIDLNIPQGRAIGLVGANGAGKSTLLKLIAGVTMPTEGDIEVFGRLASLLELGMGFKLEFSGRQNAILAGQLLGLSAYQLEELLPEIEEFSGIGRFIDEPIRIYSSGMLVRLAFSIATAVRPDILIVDEALSVGDAAFQQKCIERIRAFCDAGTTLLLVSHDENTIVSLCDEVILLDAGRVLKIGPPKLVMDLYNSLQAERSASQIHVEKICKGKSFDPKSPGTVVKAFVCNDLKRQAVKSVAIGDPVELQIALERSIPGGILAYEIKNHLGECIFGLTVKIQSSDLDSAGDVIYHFQFPINIRPGAYSISVALVSDNRLLQQRRYWQDLIYCFEVVRCNQDYFEGQAWLNARVDIQSSV
jgi:lipopolysaccharide transport system ATP-binding protein